MSRPKNGCTRCDWCGKLTRDRDAHYLKPDGVNYGRIVQPEWTRFPGGEETAGSMPDDRDICEECAEDHCPACGSERIVRLTPTMPGPSGWGGRCKACGWQWGLTAREGDRP